jgi:hypothetical protein
MRYPNGQSIRLTTTVRDLTGALVDAGSLTLTVKKPDATQQVYSTPVHDSTGTYHQDVPATDLSQNGHYLWVFTASGTGAGVSRGDFDVFDPFEPAILPLSDAKDALNIPQATTTWDTRIQTILDTVTAAIENITGGPLFNRTITERVELNSRYTTFLLRQRPVVSISAMTDVYGVSIPITDLDIDTNSGVVKRIRGLPWLVMSRYVNVTYLAGWGTAIPAAFAEAARIIVIHLWETQRSPTQRTPLGLEETIIPGMGFAIPNQAAEVLSPYTQEAYV